MPASTAGRIIGAVNLGSFRVSALVAQIGEDGEVTVLGAHHRKADGFRRGYVVDMNAASAAVRHVIDKAEQIAERNVRAVWVGCSGAGLRSEIVPADCEIGGRRVEPEDVETLLLLARDQIGRDRGLLLHAQPALYTMDDAQGVLDPVGMHAERLGVHVHAVLADHAPIKNIREVVQNAHYDVAGLVASPIAAAQACLTEEELDLGCALVEFGGEVTTIALFSRGRPVGLQTLPWGSADMTEAIASQFGIRRGQAERLKCVHGSALASLTDQKEMLPIVGLEAEGDAGEEAGQIARVDLIGVIGQELAGFTADIGAALKGLGGNAGAGRQIVLTGGGAELAGIADYMQGALGRPVRLGRPGFVRGMAEAHSGPGFATLAGLALHAANPPLDLRQLRASSDRSGGVGALGKVRRIWQMMKDGF
ncbi:cell division protein FtsA [Pseudoblastomonas halimionae]|uniref:Cell division protein FtsA n=1 Tax=Alteriqipengyuania halimionae TaxID=1926630 RepID=A0A6I4U280_9SPHN|nr:cell division protein FtsA [Alteriqipengyuania halimionae]MXP10120.1 cell division protein FtsA [Alteriqipengyuania halimionae]